MIISLSAKKSGRTRSEEHTSELQSQSNLVCRLLLEKKKMLARTGKGGDYTPALPLSFRALRHAALAGRIRFATTRSSHAICSVCSTDSTRPHATCT